MRTKLFLIYVLALSFALNSWAQQKHGAGMVFDDAAYEETPIADAIIRDLNGAKLAMRASLKAFAPIPQDQGSYNNCVGWATAYAARTILEARHQGWRNAEVINQNAFSPGFIYKLISDDNSCYSPAAIDRAMEMLKTIGAVKHSDIAEVCPSGIPQPLFRKATSYKIEDYKRLFYVSDRPELKIFTVKSHLAEGNPVVVGMKCTPSFEQADGQIVWQRKEGLDTKEYFGHAVCIVGYDDKRYGGAFEIMNSWGSGWGNQGFIWVKYEDFGQFAKYAYVLQGALSTPEPQMAERHVPTETEPATDLLSSNSSSNDFSTSVLDTSPEPMRSDLDGSYSPYLFDLSGRIRIFSNDHEVYPKRTGKIYKMKEAVNNSSNAKLELQVDRPAYIYVMGKDKENNLFEIYPGGNQNAEGSASLAGKSRGIEVAKYEDVTVNIPNADNLTHMCVFYSKKPLDLAPVMKKMKEERWGSFSRRVFETLEEDLVLVKHVYLFSSTAAFSAQSRERSIIPVVIEMNNN